MDGITDSIQYKARYQDSSSRDYHNALERRRRKLISGKFELLRQSIPRYVYGERADKVPRCLVLKSACHYIDNLEKTNSRHKSEIEKLRQENEILENEIARLEYVSAFGEEQEDTKVP
eukprot:gene10582-19317_t